MILVKQKKKQPSRLTQRSNTTNTNYIDLISFVGTDDRTQPRVSEERRKNVQRVLNSKTNTRMTLMVNCFTIFCSTCRSYRWRLAIISPGGTLPHCWSNSSQVGAIPPFSHMFEVGCSHFRAIACRDQAEVKLRESANQNISLPHGLENIFCTLSYFTG